MVTCEQLPRLQSAASDEESTLRVLVEDDPGNFNAWTALMAEVEKTSPNDIQRISSVYDSFLVEFPLCYGYWKKYAEHTARLCSVEEAIEVYERGVQSATYSVGLWASYCSFSVLSFEDLDDVRRLFERGLSYVRKDYMCHILWDKYLEFELSQKEWARVAYIYIRILRFPIKKVGSYYESFKKLVSVWEEEIELVDNSSSELLSEVLPGGDSNEQVAYQEQEILNVIKDLMDPPVGSLWKSSLKKYFRIGEYFYEKSSNLKAKISCFEDCIRRPYFHVKLLDDSQIQNWHQYLDFVETLGDFDWTVKLYERCLISCANYPEFWIRYVELMEEKGGRELANLALARATQTFVKTVPGIHLFCARYRERIGDIFGARAAFQRCSSDTSSQFIENVKRQANMEKRQGNVEAALDIYKKAIELAKEMHNSQTLSILYVHFFEFTYMVTGDTGSARDVLISGLQYLPQSKLLLEQLIHFEKLHGGYKKIHVVGSIVAQATAPGPTVPEQLNAEDREQISRLFLELVDLCGTIHEIKEAWDRHQKLFPYLFRPASFGKNASVGDSLDKAEVCTTQNAVPSDSNNRVPVLHDLDKKNTTHIESLHEVTCQMASNVSNNGSDERLTEVGLEIAKHERPKLDLTEESAPALDLIHEQSTDPQTLESSRENLQNISLDDSESPDKARQRSLETVTISSRDDDESSQSVYASCYDNGNPEVASSTNANLNKDTDATSNIVCVPPKMPSQFPSEPNSDSPPPAKDLRLSKGEAPKHQQPIGSSGIMLSHDSTNQDSWHQASFPAQASGNQGSQVHAQVPVQHPQPQWQISQGQHFSQAEIQSQTVMPSYPHQQPQAWPDPQTQQTHSMQNQYTVGPAQAYPGGVFVWPSQNMQQPVETTPQSITSSQSVGPVQTPQYSMQNKEQFLPMHSNHGYDPQLWQYYQQQQQLLLQQQHLLQQQQQQPLMNQQQQQQLQLQLQQQQSQMSIMHQQQQLLLQQQHQQHPHITPQQHQHHPHIAPQQHQQHLHIAPQQHQQHPHIAPQQPQMPPQQQQMTISHAQTWNNYNTQQALPVQYYTSTQYRPEYSQQAVGGQPQVQATLANSGAASTPVYQQQQAPFI